MDTPRKKNPNCTHRLKAASTSRAFGTKAFRSRKPRRRGRPPAKKASLKSVESPPAKKTAAVQPVAEDEPTLAAEPEVADNAADEEVGLGGPALESLDVDLEAETLTADAVVDLESEEVVLTVGKKRSLDDMDESAFEPVEEAKLEEELAEDEGFTLSEADGFDEQQVMAAGATADPVKDYLKQIGKVALLNAEQEVELAAEADRKPDCLPTRRSTTITLQDHETIHG